MEYNPLVSIIIPVYNGDPYLAEAIDSCLAQTYSNIEIIVVNDGSRDEGKTSLIARRYGSKIRYFEKENGGVSSALNFGISQMRGEWFSWLSHDDLYEPDKIRVQIDAVSRRNNKVCVVRCSSGLINYKGEPLFRVQKSIAGEFNSFQMMRLHYLKGVSLYGCSLLIHKDILNNCGQFDEELRAVQDAEYWARIMFHGYEFVSLSGAYVKIRIHAGQATLSLRNRFGKERDALCSRLISYYREDEIRNFDLLYIFTLKQAKEVRYGLVKRLNCVLKSNKRYGMKKRLQLFVFCIYGHMYLIIKKTYKKIFVRRA